MYVWSGSTWPMPDVCRWMPSRRTASRAQNRSSRCNTGRVPRRAASLSTGGKTPNNTATASAARGSSRSRATANLRPGK